MSRIHRAVGAVVLAVALAPALAGCFANPVEDLVRGGVEQAVEEATGGDVSLGGELPEGWPEEVPVIDGELGFGGAIDQADAQGWVVTITTDAADPIADARASLAGAGFTEATDAVVEGTAMFQNANFGVLVAAQDGTVIYTVTPLAQ